MELRRRRPRGAEPVIGEEAGAPPPAWLKAPEVSRAIHIVTKAVTPTTLADLATILAADDLKPIRDVLAVLYQIIHEVKQRKPEVAAAAVCLLGTLEALDSCSEAETAAAVEAFYEELKSPAESADSNGAGVPSSASQVGNSVTVIGSSTIVPSVRSSSVSGHSTCFSSVKTASAIGRPLSMGLALSVIRPGSSSSSSSSSASASSSSSAGSSLPAAASSSNSNSSSNSAGGSSNAATGSDGSGAAAASSSSAAVVAAGGTHAAVDDLADELAVFQPYLAAANSNRVIARIVGMAAFNAALRSGVIISPVEAKLDSGCAFSCFSMAFSKKNLHAIFGPGTAAVLHQLQRPAPVGMFAGAQHTYARYVATGVTLDIGKGSYRQDFLIIDNGNFDLVLGNDFLFAYAGRIITRDVSDRFSGRYLVLPLHQDLCQPGVMAPDRPPRAGPFWYPHQRVPLRYEVVEEAWPAVPVLPAQV